MATLGGGLADLADAQAQPGLDRVEQAGLADPRRPAEDRDVFGELLAQGGDAFPAAGAGVEHRVADPGIALEDRLDILAGRCWLPVDDLAGQVDLVDHDPDQRDFALFGGDQQPVQGARLGSGWVAAKTNTA
jgi:hypothetical protein